MNWETNKKQIVSTLDKSVIELPTCGVFFISSDLHCNLCKGTGEKEREELSGGETRVIECEKCFGAGVDPYHADWLENLPSWPNVDEHSLKVEREQPKSFDPRSGWRWEKPMARHPDGSCQVCSKSMMRLRFLVSKMIKFEYWDNFLPSLKA